MFPAVDMPRAIQVLAGSFPIAQTREPYSAVGFLAERLEIERVYGLQPPPQGEPVEVDAAGQPMPFRWSAWTLCEALAQKKGFFQSSGAAGYLSRRKLHPAGGSRWNRHVLLQAATKSCVTTSQFQHKLLPACAVLDGSRTMAMP